MRKHLVGLAVASTAIAVMATDARIETMGGNSNFIKDDQSIFTNPATIADYDKMLIGSFGIYKENGADSANIYNQQFNRDAARPNFGATMSWGETEESKSKFTVGAVFNRYDDALKYISPTHIDFVGAPKNSTDAQFLDSLVGKIDLITGYTMDNGLTIGLGGYLAFQEEQENNVTKAMSRLAKGTIGISGPVGSNNTTLDASFGLMAITLDGYENANNATKVSSAHNDIGFTIDLRSFSRMEKINGDFVPHIQANILNHHDSETLLDFNAGVGFNSHIDRGFLWGGFEGLYVSDSYSDFGKYYDLPAAADTTGKRSRIGGRVSFGIERNVLTDWLVWRVGASKMLAYEKLDEGNVASYWVQNPEDDHVSFGMGVNIENRFKVDAVVAENLLYTFSNLFSGSSHHFSSKISATFAF